VSSFETFHFTKPHPAFFAEVLGRLGWQNGPVVMVGDDAERDLQPAQDLGLRTFHVADGASAASGTMGEGRGSLSDLRPWLESMDPAALEPDLQSPSAILAVLASTPAVLHSLTAGVPESCWPRKPGAQEWALVEVLCHLRDTEREIHQMQVETLLAENDPFIPRPDGSVWAKERNYLEEDGPSALRQFAAARMSTLARLQGLDGAVWTQKARHAIFGPTHFREVIGFMAEHDRMHVQQAWNILQTL
jgi:hypothetical protein